jgi:tetratricopeptide (TPR) repeat protein
LEQAALVSVESLPGVEPPFLRFHPTLVPYLATQLPAERRAVLEERYRERYYKVANYLYHTDIQHPHEARAIALLEMPNLRRAFELTVAAAMEETHPSPLPGDVLSLSKGGKLGGEEERAQAAATAVDFADRIAQFLDFFGRWRERETLLARLTDLHVTSDKGLTKAEYLMLNQRGKVLWQQGRAAEAEQVFRDLLTKMEAGAAYDAAYDHATTLARLGRCLEAQGRPAQAIEYFRRVLQAFEDLSESDEDAKKMLGEVYTDLGIT